MGRGEAHEQIDLGDLVRTGLADTELEDTAPRVPAVFYAHQLEVGQTFLLDGELLTVYERDETTDRENAVLWATRDDGGDECEVEAHEIVEPR